MWMNMALSIMSLQPRAFTQTHSFSTNNSSSLRPEQEAINTSLPACVASEDRTAALSPGEPNGRASHCCKTSSYCDDSNLHPGGRSRPQIFSRKPSQLGLIFFSSLFFSSENQTQECLVLLQFFFFFVFPSGFLLTSFIFHPVKCQPVLFGPHISCLTLIHCGCHGCRPSLFYTE